MPDCSGRLLLRLLLLGLTASACPAAPQPGQIIVDPQRPAWFKYAGGGPFYMSGPGDPEDFLYRGTRNADGTRNGDQTALIDKMIGTGANCIYLMAVRSHGGDGDATHNPFVDNDPTKSLNQAILNQWETWFTAMDDNGIVIYFFFYDDSSSPYGKQLPADGKLKAEEAAFINAIVSRFKHHRHLVWCVAEEYAEGLSAAHASRIAEQIKLQDDRQHPVAIHQNHGTSFNFNGNPAFDQFAVQWNVSTPAQLHSGTVAARLDVGGLVNVNMSEFAPLSTGLELQRKLWAIALGGGYSMVLGMDIASTPVSDLQTCGRLVRFMEATQFNQAAPRDDLARNDTDYVLASPGETYIAYADGGSGLGLWMEAGNYAVRWYDPATGIWSATSMRGTGSSGTQVFTKPAGFGEDAALYVSRTIPAPASDPFPLSGALRIRRDMQLAWTPGAGAMSHQVYFGTSSPGTFQGSQTSTTFDPGLLATHTTYFWRIDEVNEKGIVPGAVWTFTTDGLGPDFDGDGDVDQQDFGSFQLCLSPGEITPTCGWADFNRDHVVDQQDCALFLNCLSGPDNAADPACLP